MTRVLVTGASTPIGGALIRALLRDARIKAVLAVHAPGEPPIEAPGAAAELFSAHANLTRERDVRTLLFRDAKAARIDVLVHTALHRAARDGGARVHRLNVESTRQFLRLCDRHETIRHFVFRSTADVYRVRAESTLLTEDHPLEMSRLAPQWVRDRVEADLTVAQFMGLSRSRIALLRTAECLAPATGGQLWDYLRSRVCFTPLGYDPMLNVISVRDVVEAMLLAVFSDRQGTYNVPGADTLPLSRLVRLAGRYRIPAPGPLLAPLYAARATATGTDFRYDQNYWHMHFGGLLDGTRAREQLGFVPRFRVPLEALR